MPSATLRMRLEAAVELGWRAECLDPETSWLWQVSKGGRQRLVTGPVAAINTASAARLAADKHHTATVLASAGLRVPDGVRCLRPDAFIRPVADERGDAFASHRGMAPALAFAERVGYPLVVKPNRGSQGKGIALVEDSAALLAAIDAIWATETLALVQAPLPGLDLRIDVLDGELLVAYVRRPLRLSGDGEETVAELLVRAEPRAASALYRARLHADPLWRDTLAAAGLDHDAVVPAGQTVAFPATILNLNRCCTAEVFTEIPDPWLALAVEIAGLLGLRHAGVDLRIDAEDPLAAAPGQATVLEVNASPAVVQIARMGWADVARAAERKVARAFLAD